MDHLEKKIKKNEEDIRILAKAMLSTRSMYMWGTMMNALIFSLFVILGIKGVF